MITVDFLKEFLDKKVIKYNNYDFIENDPIQIPHSYKIKQDIEISGFFAAILGWGNRKIIIRKCKELLSLMDNSPYDFILNHELSDLTIFKHFKHRTFNYIDCLYFINFLKFHYSTNKSLESAFIKVLKKDDLNIKNSLINFHNYFFSLEDSPLRTRKHVATPMRNSACKRLNMFLRWMVRKDDKGVDFGIWNNILSSQLMIPCDVHVLRVSRKLRLLERNQSDWKAALELTNKLKQLCPEDPVVYDFALFGLGVEQEF